MTDIAIRVENLSKRYRIGLQEERHDTLVKAVTSFVRQPLRNLRNLRRLSRFDNETANDIIWALRDISFEVKQGEVVGIIGRNGAGKSTLLKILSRITHPTGGRVELRGRVSSLLEVGTGFHQELTGRENVYLNGTILGMRKAEIDRKFDEIVEFSGVEKFIDTPVKRYSSGMRVRLAFAVAAHLEPELLLVDEVLAVGDQEFQRKCLGKMGDVASQGRTILFVSHNMGAIQNLCRRSILLDSGRIEKIGDTESVISKYLFHGKENASFDLAQREDRRGDGSVILTTIRLFRSGEEITEAQCGKELNIHIGYVRNQASSSNGFVRIAFKDDFGQRLFMCLSKVSNGGPLYLRENGEIVCKIPTLPLLPGKYSVDIWCKVDETLADSIENAFSLEVIQSNYLGTAYKMPKDGGSVAVAHTWEMCSSRGIC